MNRLHLILFCILVKFTIAQPGRIPIMTDCSNGSFVVSSFYVVENFDDITYAEGDKNSLVNSGIVPKALDWVYSKYSFCNNGRLDSSFVFNSSGTTKNYFLLKEISEGVKEQEDLIFENGRLASKVAKTICVDSSVIRHFYMDDESNALVLQSVERQIFISSDSTYYEQFDPDGFTPKYTGYHLIKLDGKRNIKTRIQYDDNIFLSKVDSIFEANRLVLYQICMDDSSEISSFFYNYDTIPGGIEVREFEETGEHISTIRYLGNDFDNSLENRSLVLYKYFKEYAYEEKYSYEYYNNKNRLKMIEYFRKGKLSKLDLYAYLDDTQ